MRVIDPEEDDLSDHIASPSRGWGGFLLILIALVVEGFDLQDANFAAEAVMKRRMT